MVKYWVFRLAAVVLPWMPRSVGQLLAGWAGEVAYLWAGRSRRAVMANLLRAMGPEASLAQRRQATREVFRTAMRNYFDLFRLPHLQLHQLDSLVQLNGFHHFEEAVARRRGVIIVAPHFGNFDVVGQVLAARHYEVLVPVEPLKPPALLELMTRLRRSKGLNFVPVGPAALRAALRTLQQGGTVGLAVDRDIQRNGILVPFFGQEARLPTGTVDLARRTGALLLPAVGLRRGRRSYAVFIEPALAPEWTTDQESDRRRVLGQLISIVERHIRQNPGQWVVFEPVWNAVPARTGNRVKASVSTHMDVPSHSPLEAGSSGGGHGRKVQGDQ